MNIFKNKFKKVMTVGCGLILVLSFVCSVNTFAYDDSVQYGETSMYFADYDSDKDVYTNKLNDVIKDNYWSNLQAVDVETIEGSDNFKSSYFKIALPKYLLKPDETDINSHAKHIDFGSFGGYEFYNFGIIPNWGGFAQVDRFLFKDNPGENPYLQQTFKILEGQFNPFNFKPGKDTLTEEEAVDPLNKLKVLTDIKAKDSTDSKKIDEYKKGDSLDLNFSMSAPWFKRLYNSHAMAKMQIGGISEEGAKKLHDQFIMSDSQIVFTLEIPKGVTINDNPTAKVSGIEGFTTTVLKDGNTLVIKLRKDERAKVYKWQELVDKVNSINTNNISVSISGLSVSSEAVPESEISIKGTASAVYDFATSRTEKFYLHSKEHNSHEELGVGHENSSERLYWSFAAVQDPKGFNEGAPQDKPNLISYTFKVNKPANNTVTFIDGDNTLASVMVEAGKAIDNDALTNESMPKDPTKSGYTFKEWNTQKDGKGTKFTGTAVVNKDMIVYAIYSLNSTPINIPPILELRDKTITIGNEIELKELIVKSEDSDGKDLKNITTLVNDGGFDNNKAGKYTIMFKVTDKNGTSVTKNATITVNPKSEIINSVPMLKVKDKTIDKGEKLDLMSLVVTAEDKEDGDLTKDVKLIDDGGFDNNKVGKYTITFKVTDKNRASVTKKAIVTVKEKNKLIPNSDNNKFVNDKNSSDTKTLPKTGITANISLYVILTGLWGILLIVLVIKKK
ncbi:immunoglobulin-like domain-containing protein [Gemella bergeri]